MISIDNIPTLSAQDARSESISVRTLAQLVSKQDNPDSETLNKAMEFLDSLKVLDPITYLLRVASDNLCAEISTEIGKDKLGVLIGELNYETQQIFPTLDTSLKPGTSIPHEAITGWAIANLSQRPTHQDIKPEIWGKLFSAQTCMQKIYLSRT